MSTNCLPCTMRPTDIISLINRVFHICQKYQFQPKSFGRSRIKPSKQNFVRAQGIDWKVQCTCWWKHTYQCNFQQFFCRKHWLNIHQGLAATILDQLISEQASSSKAKNCRWDEEVRLFVPTKPEGSRQTFIRCDWQQRIHSIWDPRFLEHTMKREEMLMKS